MKERKQFHRAHTDRKLHWIYYAFVILMLIMFIIVLHDSFVHNLPFYYILFLVAGLVIGRLVAFTQSVQKSEAEQMFTMKVKPFGLVLTGLLIFVRFYVGKILLSEFNVIWTVDAVYLLFIGIYYARWRNIVRQVDERIFTWIQDSEKK